MAKTDESPKKPLKNSKRPILKTGQYRCCDTEWTKKGITLGQKFECRKCNKEVGPKKQETWNKRWYGYFGCVEKGCKSTWVSSNTWTVDNKIQTTQCRKCKTSVLPYIIVSEILRIITNRVSTMINSLSFSAHWRKMIKLDNSRHLIKVIFARCVSNLVSRAPSWNLMTTKRKLTANMSNLTS